MPKGKQRTPDEIRAELLARKEQLEASLAKLDKEASTKAKKDRAAENYELGALVRFVLESDTGVKRKLVDAAKTQSLKDHQRRTLERVLGAIGSMPKPDGDQARA